MSRSSLARTQVVIDGRQYRVVLSRSVALPKEAPRILVVGHQPTTLACDMLRVCVEAIRRYTPEEHELWVVDNNSPWNLARWLAESPEINVVFNRTEPLPAADRTWRARWRGLPQQPSRGSYANAVAIEIGSRLFEADCASLMTVHMDALPCTPGWLSYLASKIQDNVAAAGVRMDRKRNGDEVLHVLGLLVDLRVLRSLKLDFFPRPPLYDVGDFVTVGLRRAGYEVFGSANSLWDPQVRRSLSDSSVFKTLEVDLSVDDEGNVFFLHLGRGVRKAHGQAETKLGAEAWVRFARQRLLQ